MRAETTYADRNDGDFGTPTPERANIANGSLQKDELFAPNSRVPIATRYKITGPIGKMALSDRERKAAELFYRAYMVGHRTAGLTMKYGERMGTGGTPASQQRTVDDYCPEHNRVKRLAEWRNACNYVGHKATAYWLTHIVCEIPVNDEVKPPSLEDVGRAWMGYQCQKRAQASGATLIKSGLERLADFYGIRD
jgi:hypothetical protein